MNLAILSQENPKIEGFGTKSNPWWTQATNIFIAVMNQVAFPTSELLQLSHPSQNVIQRWIMGDEGEKHFIS